MMLWLVASLFGFIFTAACALAYHAGKSDALDDENRRRLDALRRAEDIRDHLAADDDYAARVRARFSR